MRSRSKRSGRAVATMLAAAALCLLPPVEAGAAEQWFDVVGGGFGHGVGMSQWGARARAEAGHGAGTILGAYYPGASLQTMAPAPVRVRLGRSTSTTLQQPSATMVLSRDGVTPIAAVPAGQVVTAARRGASVVAWIGTGTPVDLGPTGYVGLTQGAPVTVSLTGRRYRWGRVALHAVGTQHLDVVLDLPVERYLYGLAEMPASWPSAALDAQAIAGRTFAAYRLRRPRAATFDVEASTADQYYRGYDHEVSAGADRWIAAVNRTSGRILTSGGAPILAFYSSSNGGHSEVAEYVFASPLPYLAATPDPFDETPANPNRRWVQRYSGTELRTWLRAAGHPDVGQVVGVDVLGGRGASGRVDRATVRVRGVAGSFTLSGNQLRSAVNAGAPSSRDLRSTRFFVAGGMLPGHHPVGVLERAVRVAPGRVAVSGWAADPDAPDAATLVLVAVDGRLVAAWRADGRVAGGAAGVSRLDPNVGFGGVVVAAGGPSEVCVGAVNVGPGDHRLLGCQRVPK